MADVTGRIGDNDVALDNAATEATLKALLLAVSGSTAQMNKLINLASKSGMDPKSIEQANKGANALGQAAFGAGKIASVAMGGLAKTAMVLGGVIGDLTASAFKTIGNLTDFAGKLLDGTASVSGLFGAFKDLPLGIGLVAGLFEKLAQMQEANLTAYRELSKSGINLGGDLNDIRLQALDMGTTLEGFTKLMKENSKTFAGFGGTVDEGARNFMRFSKELRNSSIGQTLSGLGLTLEDMSQGAANYIKISGGRSSEELKNTKALVSSSGEYMKQLDMLAGLTGRSREEQEKLLQEESANAAWQAHLQTMGEEERKKAIAAFNDTLQTGGKGAASALRSKIMGIPPLDEAGQTFLAMARNGSEALDKVTDSVKDQRKSLTDVNKDMAGFRVGLGKDGKQLIGPLGAALIAQGGAMGDFASKAISTQNQLKTQNVKSVEDEIALRKRLADEAAKRETSAAAQAAESEKQLKALGAELMGALLPVFKAMTPIINDLAQKMLSFARDNMPAIEKGATILAGFLKNFVQDIFTDAGRDKIINDIVYAFKLILIEVKKAIKPFYDEDDAKADRAKLDIEKKAFDSKAEVARTQLEITNKETALTKQLQDKKQELSQAERSKIEADLAALKKTKDAQAKTADAASKRDTEIKEGDTTVKGWGGAAAGAATLGTAGAIIGSIVPVIGTAVGGAIGAAIGAGAGSLGLIDYGIKGSKLTEEELNGSDKKKPPPAAHTGGIFNGPKTGYDVKLHGNEAVVPLGGGGISRSSLGDLMKNLPSANDVASKIQNVANNPQAALADATKAVSDFGQKLAKAAEPLVQDASNGVKGAASALGIGGNEKLIAELQTLNNISRQTLGYIKRAVEFDERQLEATRSLNGNLFQ